jgi:hypothetical protein
MGTRADFYVGRGADAEWIGSVTWDGYPVGVADDVPDLFAAADEAAWRQAVAALLAARAPSSTLPSEPWPWPWEDSGTTDYAYALDGSVVYGTSFGHGWWPVDPDAESYGEPDDGDESKVAFPDMKLRQGDLSHVMAKSGLIVFRA